MAGVEVYRGAAEREQRVYPGGPFDPVGLAKVGAWSGITQCLLCGHMLPDSAIIVQYACLDMASAAAWALQAIVACWSSRYLSTSGLCLVQGNADELKLKEIKNGRLAMVRSPSAGAS